VLKGFLAVLSCVLSLAVATTANAQDTPAGAAVVIRGESLIVITERLGSFTPAERAAAVRQRLLRLGRGGHDSITVVPGEASHDLLAGDNILLTVTEADANAAGLPREQLASRWAESLTRGLQSSSLLAVTRALLLGAAWTALATLLLVGLLRLLGRFAPRLTDTVEKWHGTRLRGIRFQRLELLSARRETDALKALIGGTRVLVVILLWYFYVVMVLSFFPWTAPVSENILDYVLTPLARAWIALVEFLPNLFFIAVIIVITRLLLRLVRFFFTAVEHGTVSLPNFEAEWAMPTYKIARFLVIAFAVIVIFPYLPGSNSAAFRGVSIFLGALFSIGSSSAIANIVAGVVLTYTRAYRVGDRVQIGETSGDVVAKTLLVTRVRTTKNVDVTIPNAMVLGAHTLNYTTMARSEGLILHTGVTIGYDAPWRKVHELLIAAALATPGIRRRPEPFVLQKSLDDSYVSYELNAYTDEAGAAAMQQLYSALHAGIQDRFNEAGVEIMSPHYRAERDGNPSTIPAGHAGGAADSPAAAG
jgi:small-conductance mechanosensitive channel